MNGILVIAYGTDKGETGMTAARQAEKLSERIGKKVYTAFMKGDPTIPEAVETMKSEGVDSITAIPFLISNGSVAQSLGDIIGDSIPVKICNSVGTDPGIADVIAKRVTACGGDNDTPVLVVGHGSKDDSNPNTINAAVETLKGKGFPKAVGCFNEFSSPSVEEAFADALSSGSDLIVVSPMFISLGKHLTEDVPPKIGMDRYMEETVVEHEGKKITVKYAPPIGNDEYLCEIMEKMI